MYENIIFDLYGTLIDIHTEEEDIAVWKRLCEFYAQYGIKYNPAGLRSRYKRQVRRAEQAMAKKKFKFPEIQILDVFEQLTRKNDQTVDECAELTVKAAQEFRKISTEYIRLYPGVKELLADLKAAGKKLYVLPIISSPKSLIFGLFSLNNYLITSAKMHEHSLYQVLNS